MVEAVMYYLLVFLGLIGVAVLVAMSPLVIRLLEYRFPSAESDGPPARPAITRTPSSDRKCVMKFVG